MTAAISAAAAELEAALQIFLRAYQAEPALMAEQRGWSPVIALVATDVGARVRLEVKDGVVIASGPDDAACDERHDATLVVSAELRILRDVLELRCDPNEPYLFGDLTVAGPEQDFLRLDYIASRLCNRS